MKKVKVGINGFGAIGKRVAHAVTLQNDMELVGVANRSVNINVRSMLGSKGPLKKTKLYSSSPDTQSKMESTGFAVEGNLEDLLQSVDVIVDGTPGGVEEKNKPLYEKHGVKQIYQGGASKNVADISFSTVANYDEAVKRNPLRVVSCNTTSLVRTIHTVNESLGIKDVFAVLVRRATDPPDPKKGPINSIVPVTTVPSHHGPDVQTVMPEINITTMACKIPVTLNHTHFVAATLNDEYTREDVLDAFRKASRILLFKKEDGYESSSQIFELFRDIGRPRYDMYEASLWEDTVNVVKNKLYWTHIVHSEAIILPENIDAIRAVMGTASKSESIKKTNRSLGIDK